MNRYEVSVIFILSLVAVGLSLPQQQKSKRPTPVFKKKATQGLELPSNATSIRENIVDTFSCDGRVYGYYADVENECQVFHVCMPQERGSTRWSFICPAETVFNQATFVCTRTEGSIPCEESEQYYVLNEEIGKIEEEEKEEEEKPENSAGDNIEVSELPTPSTKVFRRGKSRKITETTEAEEEAAVTVSSSRSARISSRRNKI